MFSFTNRRIIISELNKFISKLKTSNYPEDKNLVNSMSSLVKTIEMLNKAEDKKKICSDLIEILGIMHDELYKACASKKRIMNKILNIIKKATKDLIAIKQNDKSN